MSRILPDPPAGNFSPDVVGVFLALKALPGDDIVVWVSLPLPGNESRPEFLVLFEQRAACLIAVSDVGQTAAEEAAGESLFSSSMESEPPGWSEEKRIRDFLRPLGDGTDDAPYPLASVRGLVLFPRVAESTIRALYGAQNEALVRHHGSEKIQPEQLGLVLRNLAFAAPPADESLISQLRAQFTPESVVPIHFSTARYIDRNLAPRLTPLFLDFEQEKWAKHQLRIPEGEFALAENPPEKTSATLVTGVAGSGKSLVLLFRACTQARLSPKTRSLVLTHNRALKVELQRRFGDLGRPPNVRWHTFFSWAVDLLRQAERVPKILEYAERDTLIETCARPFFGPLLPHQVEFLREEFDWMQDCGIEASGDYLSSQRSGRVVPLSTAQRQKVHLAFVRYRERLAELGASDWSGIALRLWRSLETGSIKPHSFDFIYIDEAQFFAPIWFKSLLRALKPGSGRILLAADPTQGFLKRRQSWLACGLDLRGKSTRLRRCYRSCREILEFAAAFYRSRVLDDDPSELNLPGEEELSGAPSGLPPTVLLLTAKQDEITRVCREIAAYLDQGGDASSILVLFADSFIGRSLREALARHFGAERVADAREPRSNGTLRISSIEAATGLESPLVFLVGLGSLLESEERLGMKPEQRAELIRDNTRKIYMAFTRAGWSLSMTWSGSSIPDWLNPFVCPPSRSEGALAPRLHHATPFRNP